MALADDVAAVVGTGGKLIVDLHDYSAEAVDGLITQSVAWPLDGLDAVEVIGHGYYTVRFTAASQAYDISLVGVPNVHFSGWTYHRPSNPPVIGIRGARAFTSTSSSDASTSLNNWYWEHFTVQVSAKAAGLWLHGVELFHASKCGFTNNYAPTTATTEMGYAIFICDNNPLGIAGGGSEWQNTNAVTATGFRFDNCSTSQYATYNASLPTACIALQSNVKNFLWTSGVTGSSSNGYFLHVKGTNCGHIYVRDAYLEGDGKTHAFRLDNAVTDFECTGGFVEATTAVAHVYDGASTGKIEPDKRIGANGEEIPRATFGLERASFTQNTQKKLIAYRSE